jgi:hypothetical protein
VKGKASSCALAACGLSTLNAQRSTIDLHTEKYYNLQFDKVQFTIDVLLNNFTIYKNHERASRCALAGRRRRREWTPTRATRSSPLKS